MLPVDEKVPLGGSYSSALVSEFPATSEPPAMRNVLIGQEDRGGQESNGGYRAAGIGECTCGGVVEFGGADGTGLPPLMV